MFTIQMTIRLVEHWKKLINLKLDTMTQVSKKSFSQLLDSEGVKNRIQSVLKEKSTQFVTSALSLVNSDEKLQSCEPSSIFNACLVSASLDLPINNNLGFAYIIPYNDRNRGMIAQFQIG